MTKSGARNRVRRGKPSLAAPRVTNPTWQNALKRSCGLCSAVILVDSGPLVPAGALNDPHHRVHRVARLCNRGTAHTGHCVCRDLLHAGDRSWQRERKRRSYDYSQRENWSLSISTPLTPSAMAELVEQYADFPLGETAASLIAALERLGVTKVATLDRRHFSPILPRHTDALTCFPNVVKR